MQYLTDFRKLTKKAFWAAVDTNEVSAAKRVEELFQKAMEKPLTQPEAAEALDMLFLDSHARIRKLRPQIVPQLLVKSCTPGKLEGRDNLWWMDHFTGGFNALSTIDWFSQGKVSTHFVLDFHGRPFYIVPLQHGAWHEPRRNKDAVAIEMVNPGGLHQEGGEWHFWAGKVPADLIQKLPPIRLPKPYRGVSVLMPFTRDQLINNLILKRIVLTALPGKFIPERMTQHMDWRETKTDMGPLWPLSDLTAASFELDPVLEYEFIQHYEDAFDAKSPIKVVGDEDHSHNPDQELFKEDPEDWDIHEVQNFLLVQMHYSITLDGVMGPKTKKAIMDFQVWWNKKNPKDLLIVDGMPGPKTVKAMKSIH